jgi:hypothetical protein
MPCRFNDEDAALVFHPEVSRLDFPFYPAIAQYVQEHRTRAEEAVEIIVKENHNGRVPDSIDNYLRRLSYGYPLAGYRYYVELFSSRKHDSQAIS